MNWVKVSVFVAALLLPSAAFATSVFLNGVNIDGVTNQVFKKCKVRIDKDGNVHITARGYRVKGGGSDVQQRSAAASAKSDAKSKKQLEKSYWLVTEKAAPGMSQYHIDLYVNGKWVRKFLDQESQVVMKLNKHLRPGTNKLTFVAKKSIDDERRSRSPQHYFRIVVGRGESGGRNVMITKKYVDYKRTALETKNFRDDFTLDAQ